MTFQFIYRHICRELFRVHICRLYRDINKTIMTSIFVGFNQMYGECQNPLRELYNMVMAMKRSACFHVEGLKSRRIKQRAEEVSKADY